MYRYIGTMGASKGSKKYIQRYVNGSPEILNKYLFSESPSLQTNCINSIAWVSPLATEGHREYRDTAFLKSLGLGAHADKLALFWPSKGPCWDALAKLKTASGAGAILVEAKSHLNETPKSDTSRAKDTTSIEKIDSAFNQARDFFGVPASNTSWRKSHYQICNRLTHFYFMNEVLRVSTWLVWFFIINDPDWPRDGASAKEWKAYLENVYRDIGMPEEHRLKDRIITVYAPSISEA